MNSLMKMDVDEWDQGSSWILCNFLAFVDIPICKFLLILLLQTLSFMFSVLSPPATRKLARGLKHACHIVKQALRITANEAHTHSSPVWSTNGQIEEAAISLLKKIINAAGSISWGALSCNFASTAFCPFDLQPFKMCPRTCEIQVFVVVSTFPQFCNETPMQPPRLQPSGQKNTPDRLASSPRPFSW